MTRRSKVWLAALVIVLFAVAVVLTILPDEYGCNSSPIPGTTSLDGRNYTCPEATRVMETVLRGEGRPIRGSRSVISHRWRCTMQVTAILCTRGSTHWLVAVTQD